MQQNHGDGVNEAGRGRGRGGDGENHERRGPIDSTGQKSESTGETTTKQSSRISELWKKLDLDIGTALMMFKGSIAPAIAIAFYQADAVARQFSTLGYLVPIITVLCVPIMPRGKYLQTVILNTLGICIGSAVALLGIWSGVQARKHTSPPGSSAGYNSSQAAVCAIWLFANIWFVNVLRAKVPALQFPVIMFSIFTNVAFTFGPLFPTIEAGKSLVKQLLEGFLVAFGISTGVNLFIVPVSSRTVVFSKSVGALGGLVFTRTIAYTTVEEQAGYIGLIRSTVKAQAAYLESLESSDMFSRVPAAEVAQNKGQKQKKSGKKEDEKSSKARTPQAKALKGCVTALIALHGKLYGDLTFAKREMAFGKLDASDISKMFTLFRGILIPLVGVSTITDIFERTAESRGWIDTEDTALASSEAGQKMDDSEKEAEKRVWNEIMKTLHEPFAIAAAAMDEAMEHAGIILELLPKPKKKSDIEAEGSTPKPGHPDFSKHLKQKMTAFYNNRGATLKAWAREKGFSEDLDPSKVPEDINPPASDDSKHRRDQQQLYLILYLEQLLYSTGLAISAFVEFADSKVADGTMSKKKLILPGSQRLRKWIMSIGKEDSSIDTESPDSMEAGNHNVYMGAGFNARMDPEHLPAKNAWEKFGNGVRTIPRFLGSTESAFGFRVALATMTIGIIAFLKDSQTFFIEQRLVWAMIIIAIGMTMTSGQSMFGFFGRVAGTTLAMVFSIIIWYIVDERTPGIIVMLWFFIFMEMYLFLKFPRFLPVWLVTIVTQVLILGYELQVRKIGVEASSVSGQPYYPIYQLAPYRLACVAGGSFVAFIWTIFPYPLSDRSWLRQDLGSTLYLLANYYSVVHSTIGIRLHNAEGDMGSKHSPGRRLEKVRHKIFAKLVLLLPSLQQHSDWQKWELSIGGKFPRKTYEAIIHRSTNIMNYLSLISYSTQTFTNTTYPKHRHWLADLTSLIDTVSPTSHQITSTLSLLSASVKQGNALPPYLQLPEPYDLSRRLEKLDKGILDARHVEEPGYAAYAVMQVASSLVMDDLRVLVGLVKELVGETDFSFGRGLGVGEESGSEGSDGSLGKGKRE